MKINFPGCSLKKNRSMNICHRNTEAFCASVAMYFFVKNQRNSSGELKLD
jgi:hypothetical protein